MSLYQSNEQEFPALLFIEYTKKTNKECIYFDDYIICYENGIKSNCGVHYDHKRDIYEMIALLSVCAPQIEHIYGIDVGVGLVLALSSIRYDIGLLLSDSHAVTQKHEKDIEARLFQNDIIEIVIENTTYRGVLLSRGFFVVDSNLSFFVPIIKRKYLVWRLVSALKLAHGDT